MLLALALHGCAGVEPIETIEVTPVPDPAPAAGLHIATSPDRDASGRAPVLAAPLPGGEAIVRDCWGGGILEGRGGGFGMGPKGGGGVPATGAAPPAPAPAPTASRPSPKPRPPPARRPTEDLGAVGGAPAPDAAAPPAEVVTAPSVPPRDQKPSSEPVRFDPGKLTDKEKDDRIVTRGEPEDRAENEPGERLDWGATVFLSNDDSMSLASAQRVLYALKRGVPVRPSEVRPHELLNYFSFDTVAPPEGTTFGVLGGAEQDGDTLTVSLAVRGANPARQPLDLTLVVDRSCSMQAEDRMGYTKKGLTLLSDNLQRGDRLDLVLFDSGSCTPLENYVVGRDDPALLRDTIGRIAPTSATNIDAGLQEAWRIQTGRDAADVHQRNRRVVLVTDAMVNSGVVDPDALAAQTARMLDEHDIRLSGVGVGLEFDDRVLDELTERGKGAYVYLGSEAVVDRVFGPGFDSLVRTVAHDVHFSLDLPDSLAMARFYGEEASTQKADVQPIHYFAGTTQLFLQDLRLRDGRVVREDPLVMRIEYRDAFTGEPVTQELHTTVGALLDGDPHNLRKGKALAAFGDLVMASAMRANACGEPLATYRARASQLTDDAEIAFVNGLVGKTCRVDLATVVPRGVELKLKVDSDQPIPEVALRCAGREHHERLSGGDTVARFTAVTPGACSVRLEGLTPMTAEVEVPSTGGDLRCVIRGGRLSCG